MKTRLLTNYTSKPEQKRKSNRNRKLDAISS
uniref:Uncharacterized protein n=1 Tax=Rhizophora mucronata TaxID=61149 RepID=A0A2P2QQA9_RHIMU